MPFEDVIIGMIRRSAKSIVSRSVLSSAFFAFLTYEWLYRARLFSTLYAAAKNSTPILAFLPASSSKLGFAAGFFQDVVCACVSALVIWTVVFAIEKIPYVCNGRCAGPVRNVVIIGMLLCVALVFCLHYTLLTYFQSGPTRGLLEYALQDFKLSSYLSYVTPLDVFFLLVIVPIYYLQVGIPDRARLVLRGVLLLGAALSIPFFLLSRFEGRNREHLQDAMRHGTASGRTMAWEVAPEISGNPVIWMFRNVLFVRPSRFDVATRSPVPEQRGTAGFIDPAFAFSTQVEEPSIKRSQTQWNVVFLLLESLNVRQLNGFPGRGSLMPFTNQLASQSLVLENHFSAGVDTDYATFAILTGLYPMPAAFDLADRADVRFPTIFSTTQSNYSNTFVTDGDTRFWYPIHLMLNAGLNETWDAQNLPTHSYRVWFSAFKDPAETTDFFIKRANSLPEPFLAIYNLQATHAPYFDYQRKGIVVESGTPQERYERDVKLVDSQIESVLNALTASGRAQRTIFVITADHGEAFGEHPGDFGHGLYLFDETVRVPMIIYQPLAIPPGKIRDVTSHVDILPTLLDLMNVHYNPMQFQGESVFRKLRRRYVFIYGPKADTVASVSRDGVKVIVDNASDQCAAYDLEIDPNELDPRPCARYQEQMNTLLEYRQHQKRFLMRYDEACHKAWPCAQIEPYGLDSKNR